MNRQARLALVTAAWATGVVPVFGQAPAAAPSGGGPVYVMKTAGQPERRVQVLKSETQPDGSILTDVKDLGTGTIYTLTNPAFLGKPAAPAMPSVGVTAPTPTPAPLPAVPAVVAGAPLPAPASPAIAPGTPRPLFGQFPNQRTVNTTPVKERLVPVDQVTTSGLPQARGRKTDPLLAGMASRSPNEPPNVMAKVFGDPMKNQPLPRVGVLPPAPVDATALAPKPKAVPGVTVVTPTAGPAQPISRPADPALSPRPALPVPKPAVAAVPPPAMAKPTDAAVALAIPAIDANAKPSAATGLFDSQTAPTGVVLPKIDEPAASPAPAVAPTAVPVPAIAATPAPTPAPVPNVPVPAIAAAPAPVPDVPAVVVPPVTEPVVAIPTVSVPAVAVPALPAEPVSVAVAPAVPMVTTGELPRDVKLMIEDIKTHKRPSFRMENATTLAESAYAKHPAAIEALLHAATNDKAGVVRGHCIARLSEIGYSDPTYLKLLDTWANDLEPAVQRAAVDAKAKLGR